MPLQQQGQDKGESQETPITDPALNNSVDEAASTVELEEPDDRGFDALGEEDRSHEEHEDDSETQLASLSAEHSAHFTEDPSTKKQYEPTHLEPSTARDNDGQEEASAADLLTRESRGDESASHNAQAQDGHEFDAHSSDFASRRFELAKAMAIPERLHVCVFVSVSFLLLTIYSMSQPPLLLGSINPRFLRRLISTGKGFQF